METNLQDVIYSENELTDPHVKYFVWQMLCGVKYNLRPPKLQLLNRLSSLVRYMHSAGVVHRDLKPSNILLNSNCDLRICDFGEACGESKVPGEHRDGWVVARRYVPPEVLMDPRIEAQKQQDIWSVGLIMAEMLQRKPLFKGMRKVEQIKLIVQQLGSPKEEELDFVPNRQAISSSLPTG